jgi:hypothetical protein
VTLAHAAATDHSGHILLSTGLVAVVLLVVVLAEKLLAQRPAPAPLAVAVSCAAAGGIHLSVIVDHWQVDPLYGAFFLLTAAAQLLAAGWVLLRPSRQVLRLVAVGSAALVLLWLQTRLLQIPLGAEAGEREAFGVLDVSSAALELITVAVATHLLHPVERRAARVQLPAHH